MPHIGIISTSIRRGRNSHRVAIYLKRLLEEKQMATVEILDLDQYRFPLFNERLKYELSPSAEMLDFASRIRHSEGIIIITPEYNGGYPASIKNVIDLLYDEWHRKPVAITTVSDGMYGGTQVIVSLQFTLWKIRAWTVPATFPISYIDRAFDEHGEPAEKDLMERRATRFLKELLWCIEAKRRMDEYI